MMASIPNADPSRPSLSSVLREFYKLVHPDRFAEHPKEKEVNEHSMKEFLTYIQEYKKRPFGSALGNPKRIPLTFYVKSPSKEDQPITLRKVEVELLLNATNPQSAKKKLGSLFFACGLASDFTVDSLLDSVVHAEGTTLQTFLSHSIPVARETMRCVQISGALFWLVCVAVLGVVLFVVVVVVAVFVLLFIAKRSFTGEH